jgi:hypothetical protein
VSLLFHYPIFLLLAGGLAFGVFLVVSGQPLGQPRPDPVTRIRRLDPDLFWDDDENVAAPSNVLGLLRPLRQDALRLVQFLSERLGLGLNARQVEFGRPLPAAADDGRVL